MFRVASTAARRALVGAAALSAYALVAAPAAPVLPFSPVGVAATERKPSSIPFTGIPGSPHERTFIAIKPDGVQRGLVGEIITRFEKKGYKLVAVKFIQPTKAQAEEHYADLSKKPFFPGLVDFFSSGPIVAMVWEGHNSIRGIRTMMGTTNPQDSAPGSIRGDYCIITGRNIIHGSDGPESAKSEITHWFKPEEVVDWTPADVAWIYETK